MVNFHIVSESTFNSGAPNSEHLYFVSSDKGLSLYKGTTLIRDKLAMTMDNPVGTGYFDMQGSAKFSGDVTVTGELKIGKAILYYDTTEQALAVRFEE